MASISVRESIRWLPAQAEEPTSTIVLTSPGRRFVDLRFLRHSSARKAADGDEDEDVVPLARLDWAIAGTSSSVATPDRGPGTTHSRWAHWIDSRTVDASLGADEGYMSPLGDGRTLEAGRMVNPATGREDDYEEVWVDSDPSPVPGDESCQIVVLQFEGRGHEERGSVVRLGTICQGLLRIGEQIRAERWEWRDQRKGWTRTKRVGDGTGLPCRYSFGQKRRGPTASVEHEGRVWAVVEADSVQDDDNIQADSGGESLQAVQGREGEREPYPGFES